MRTTSSTTDTLCGRKSRDRTISTEDALCDRNSRDRTISTEDVLCGKNSLLLDEAFLGEPNSVGSDCRLGVVGRADICLNALGVLLECSRICLNALGVLLECSHICLNVLGVFELEYSPECSNSRTLPSVSTRELPQGLELSRSLPSTFSSA